MKVKNTFGTFSKILITLALTLVNFIVLIISVYSIFTLSLLLGKENIYDDIENLIYVSIVFIFVIRCYSWILGNNRRIGALKYLIYIIFIFTFHFLPTSVKKASNIDSCLDFGGGWNYKKNGCECSSMKSLNTVENKEFCPEAKIAEIADNK